MKTIALIIVLTATRAFAMIEESGALRGFLLGQNPGSAYDHWVSHVSEGVARPGYNDYGPAWFDPQTNGFGSFELIPTGAAGDSTLARWKAVFRHALRGEWTIVDSLVIRQDTVWNYDLVRFDDTEQVADFYFLRERLDSSYVDVNVDSVEGDEVIGSFRKGWGLYVFHPEPRFAEVAIQLPHPEDDFVSIPVGIELFLQMNAKVLMIAGAGREVRWDSTGGGEYNNGRTQSDPSRNRRTAFAILHEAMCEEWGRNWNAQSSVIQLHSYDHATHADLMDIQMCAYRDDFYPNLPLRDRAEHRDIINALPRYPVEGIDGDPAVQRQVNQYVGLWSNPPYAWHGFGGPITIPSLADLTGAVPNQQASFSHVGHNVEVDPETFLHIELDEYPDGLWTPPDWVRWLPCSAPPSAGCFTHVNEYYQPFVSAMDQGYAWWLLEDDVTEPMYAIPYQATVLANNDVYLRWSPVAADRNFDTYRIYYDTTEINGGSPFQSKAGNQYRALWDFETRAIQMRNLVPPIARYRFSVQGRDLWGNFTPLSPSIGVTDSTIQNVVLRVLPDSVEVRWQPQSNDSVYHVFEYVTGDTLFRQITTAQTSFRFAADDSTAVQYEVTRVLRR